MARKTQAERIQEAEERLQRAQARVSALRAKERAITRTRERRVASALGPKLVELAKGDDEDALELIGRLARKCTAVQRADIQETLPSLELPPPEDGKTETEEDPAASGTSELGSRWSE